MSSFLFFGVADGNRCLMKIGKLLYLQRDIAEKLAERWRRKLWSLDVMEAALKDVKDGTKGLREEA